MSLSPTRLPRFHAIRPSQFITACLLMLLASAATPGKAHAQLGDVAALSSLVSYSATSPAYINATCSGSTCRLKFPPVPAGKRLLVTYVSLNTYNGTNNYLNAVLTNGVTNYGAADYRQINLPGGVVAKNDTSGFGYVLTYSGQTLFYIESGYTPTFVYNGSVLTNEYAGQGTIVGALIPQ
jgi:hypothetical protein